jgi:hypothetical protein
MYFAKLFAARTINPLRFTASILTILFSSVAAQGASVVLDIPGMESIFSQGSFGSTTIDIRFNAPRTIVAPNLLVIKSEADLVALYKLAPDPAPVVDAFFVDTLDACANVEPTVNGIFAGCAQLPGHLFVEETDLAKEAPAALMGHELGHNLNLQHDLFSSANLMAPFFPPGTELTADQVAQILQSPLIQTDASGQRFIEITPIAIVAAPEPSAALLVFVGFAVLILRAKQRRIRTQ